MSPASIIIGYTDSNTKRYARHGVCSHIHTNTPEHSLRFTRSQTAQTNDIDDERRREEEREKKNTHTNARKRRPTNRPIVSRAHGYEAHNIRLLSNQVTENPRTCAPHARPRGGPPARLRHKLDSPYSVFRARGVDFDYPSVRCVARYAHSDHPPTTTRTPIHEKTRAHIASARHIEPKNNRRAPTDCACVFAYRWHFSSHIWLCIVYAFRIA